MLFCYYFIYCSRNGEARSSESGCDSDSSDRAPGSNRPQKMNSSLFTPGSMFATFDYEQKKLLATKGKHLLPHWTIIKYVYSISVNIMYFVTMLWFIAVILKLLVIQGCFISANVLDIIKLCLIIVICNALPTFRCLI